MSPSKVSKYDRVYKTYIIDCGFTPTYWALEGITFTKLDAMRTAILQEDDPDVVQEWLDKAKVLTCSDLIAEVREFKGIPDRPKKAYTLKIGEDAENLPELLDIGGKVWEKFVGTVKTCPVCDQYYEVFCDKAHFPVSKGAGGEHVKYMVIPLCRVCHGDQHSKGIDWFMSNNRNKIFKWIYHTIFLILAEK